MNELERTLAAAATDQRDFVWIGAGLRRPWRVMTETTTYGEWELLEDAHDFLELLLAGNPQLRRLA